LLCFHSSGDKLLKKISSTNAALPAIFLRGYPLPFAALGWRCQYEWFFCDGIFFSFSGGWIQI
jgi:hypothetical protein